MASSRSSTPRGALALALAITAWAGSGCASAYLGTVHPDACTRLGPMTGEGLANTAPLAAKRARFELRAAAARRGANYVEVMFESNEPPPLLSNKAVVHVGGIAYRCSELPDGAD
jgi:hypothetical protein